MLLTQAQTLHTQGTKLLEISKNSKDLRLAMEMLRESREIILSLQHNSVKVFLEFSACLGLRLNYVIYLEFCSRNNLQMICEEDFNSVITELQKETNKEPKLIAR